MPANPLNIRFKPTSAEKHFSLPPPPPTHTKNPENTAISEDFIVSYFTFYISFFSVPTRITSVQGGTERFPILLSPIQFAHTLCNIAQRSFQLLFSQIQFAQTLCNIAQRSFQLLSYKTNSHKVRAISHSIYARWHRQYARSHKEFSVCF